MDAVGEEKVTFEKVKAMLLNDADRISDSMKYEDAYSAQRINKGRRNESGGRNKGYEGKWCNRYLQREQMRNFSELKDLSDGRDRRKVVYPEDCERAYANVAKQQPDTDRYLWHCRFGHLRMDNVNKLIEGNMVSGMDGVSNTSKNNFCEACAKGKQHRCANPKTANYRANEPFKLVHSDVCGPMPVSSLGGSRYYVSFIDDYSRYTFVYFMKNKNEVLEKFKEFHTYAMNVTGRPIKILRSDNGGEYSSKEFESFLKKNGIVHQLGVPYNPAQNGVAERMNRTIVESTQSMLSHAQMPNEFWAEAVNTSVYVRNRSPTTSLSGITPYECLFKKKPDVSNLRVFGCVAYVHIPNNQRKKLDAKSKKSIFMGYPEGVKGYKLYDPISRKFTCSRDVIFLEKNFHDFDVHNSSNFDDRVDEDIPVMIQEIPVDQNHDEIPDQRVADNAEENQADDQ